MTLDARAVLVFPAEETPLEERSDAVTLMTSHSYSPELSVRARVVDGEDLRTLRPGEDGLCSPPGDAVMALASAGGEVPGAHSPFLGQSKGSCEHTAHDQIPLS